MPKNLNNKATKARHRAEAEERQAAYDKLTPEQKLVRIDSQVGPTGATKQRALLRKEIGKKDSK